MWHSAKKVLFCILVVFATSRPAYANSKHNFYVLTLSILSYSKWENVSTPTLCVIDNASITSTFQSYIQQLSYNYRVQTVNAKDFSKSHCQAVYFSTTPPQQQQNLIQNYPYRSLLSLSINNPECEVGSIFCLYNQNNYTTFKVNLDALSHSKVHIDPRVLLLAKNAE
ncbi:YfiR family protein [Acinetobacter baumannii]|uniref:YfiR family protein n=1 Tax=Acinetobacter baumannii TaxID=470 RepID=UPI0013C8E7E4|nr:YfiR family protein [Acinetobacter baumannii]MDC5356406.1 YfiR family protein [Acinetobacter baumannii]NDW26756.1 YfiR family protein [Acinetobacter baumannii]WIH74922.1 YfiR family protein [Acinetobacter baumannii]HBM1136822.1 YfiR family protein [Acinetobacter baumannii]